jgi:hypothetical protein
MGKPNLFISGFAKAGTTVLYHYFNEHPSVYCNPYIKEPRYFSSGYLKTNGNRRFNRNIIDNEHDYLRLYKNSGDEKYIADGSVYYSYFKGIAGDIKDFNPKARIILCIRNPIDRFKSHCMMTIRDGHVKGDFMSFINSPGTSSGINLLKAGLYSTAIREYFDVFGRDNVYIAVFDDLRDNHDKFYSGICRFLGIPYKSIENKKINVSGRPRNIFLMGAICFLKWITPGFIIRKMKFRMKTRINSIFYNRNTLKNETLPEDVRKRLVEYYREDVLKTGELIGRDLTGWLG